MEFTSFSTESCAPAGDGGIVPGLVPIPNVDPDELDEAAGRLRAVGEAIEESGEGITSTWASLTSIYVAPEADTLLSALDPVSSDGSAVASGVRDAASALETFAETTRELKSRLSGLKSEAEAFRADVGWDREWLEDEDERERNNDLNNRVAAAVHEYQEAERACANAIGQHYGGTFFTGHSDKANHDQTSSGGDRTWQVYGTASAPVDQANPWGSAVDEPPGALENVFWGLGDIAVGAVVGLGVTTGLYRDGRFAYPFGTEHGQNLFTNWEEAKDSFWALVGSDGQGEWVAPDSLDAQYHNAKEAWQAYGDAIVPVSEWEGRPEYTLVNGAGNVALMALPLGWGRVFLDGPDLGSGSGPDGDGSSDGGHSANGANGAGNGLRGTDTVGMAATAPTGGQPDPGNAVSGMHESLAGLESQLGEAPSTEGTPNGSPPPVVPPAPETPTAPMGDAPFPSGDGTASSSEGAPVGGEADAPSETSDPTAQDLRDGTSDSGADTSREPWATSPIDDGSTSEQESPTIPVTVPDDNSDPASDNSLTEDNDSDPIPAASDGGSDDGSGSGTPSTPSYDQGEDQGNGQGTYPADPDGGGHPGEGTEDNSASGTDNSEGAPPPPSPVPHPDPTADYPGRVDSNGVRRFSTNDEGQAYGDRFLGNHFDNLTPEQQHAARSYTQKSYYYNTFSRMNDKDDATTHLINLRGDYFRDWLHEWFGGPEPTHANANEVRRTIEENAALFDQAISNPLPESIDMKRGLEKIDFMLDPSEGINDPIDLIGEDFTEQGYMSGSLGAESAFNDPRFQYRLQIDVPEGYNALWMGTNSLYPTQREIILPRGTKLVFTDAVQDPDTGAWDLTAEVEET